MRQRIIMFLLSLLPSSVFAQLTPVNNIQSPEASSLALYGSVPVSLYTGIPNISIPLYEVKTGSCSIPVSVSYHLASVKPDNQAGTLGMGWSLLAGGQITRTVHVMYDEKKGTDGTGYGCYWHTTEMATVSSSSTSSFVTMTGTDLVSVDSPYEVSPDEFSFNFCGYSGNFYYNKEGGWTVVSDHDIKVEFNPTYGDGFINQSQLRSSINTAYWENYYANNCFFNKFTLVTPDGCRYEFGGVDATEYCISYYARKYSDLIATTWKLTKVTTPDNRIITLTYDTRPLMCDIRYSPSYSLVTGAATTNNQPLSVGRKGYTGFLLFPVLLKKITTEDETVTFIYDRDTKYGERLSYNGLQALYWEATGYIKESPYLFAPEEPAEQFLLFTDVVKGPSETITRQRIASNLKSYKLRTMKIQSLGTDSADFYDFWFEDDNHSNGRLRLYGIGHGDQQYRFYYDKNQLMPWRYTQAATDSWGFYRGGEVSISSTPTFSLKQPVLAAARAETLREIKYPTGGKSLFSYELNNYSQYVDNDHITLRADSGCGGGLRISEIANIDKDGDTVSHKRYYYSESKNGVSSGILRRKPHFCINYHTSFDLEKGHIIHPVKSYVLTLTQMSEGGFYEPVTSNSTPDVGYSCVIEETFDGNYNSLGYTKYHYSNYGDSFDGNTYPDELALFCVSSPDTIPYSPFSSRSFLRGKLLSEQHYSPQGNLMSEKTYTYCLTVGQPMLTAIQRPVYFHIYDGTFGVATGWLTNTYTSRSFLQSVEERQYPTSGSQAFTRTTQYQYNSRKQLSAETLIGSNGLPQMKSYSYPCDVSGYDWMVARHLLTPVVETCQTADGKSVCETRSYGQTQGGVPYLSGISTTFSPSGETHVDYTVLQTDNHGNPTEVERNGVRSAIIWDYTGRNMLALVENATLQELVSNEVIVAPDQCSMEYVYFSLELARHRMLSSLFHIYKYTATNMLESETAPNGLTIYYKYDEQKRLREKYYFEYTDDEYVKHVIEQYDYHYQ